MKYSLEQMRLVNELANEFPKANRIGIFLILIRKQWDANEARKEIKRIGW